MFIPYLKKSARGGAKPTMNRYTTEQSKEKIKARVSLEKREQKVLCEDS